MLMAGRAAASVLAKKPYVKYWIAGEDYESGHDLASATWDALKKLKPSVQLMGQSWWKIGETDIIPYITQIIAAKPDFLIVSTGGSGMVNFQKVAKTTGLIQKVPFYQHTATEHSNLVSMGLDAPEGIFGTCNYFFYYPDTAANRSFVAEFQKAYNRYPRIGALYGYMAAQFMSEGFKKAGKIDKEAMINAIEGMSLDSPVGRVTLRACDHQIELPMYWGVTKKDPKYPDFLIAGEYPADPGKRLHADLRRGPQDPQEVGERGRDIL